MRKALVGAVIVALAVILACSAAVAQESVGSAVVQSVDIGQYPQVKLTITLPGGLSDKGTPEFAVTENGVDAKVSDAQALAPDAEDAGPLDVVLVIDTSGSMKGDPLESTKKAASEFADTFAMQNRIAIITVSTRPAVALPFTSDRGRIASAIDSLQAKGETSLNDALAMAADVIRSSTGKPVGIVVLSDGGGDTSRTPLDDAVKQVQDVRVPIYTVAMPSYEADPAPLRAMSTQTGGRLVATTDLAALPDLYRGIAEELQDRYLITYESNQPTTKDLEIGVSATVGDAMASGDTVIANPRFEGLAPAGDVKLQVTARNPRVFAGAVALVFGAAVLMIVAIGLFVIQPKTTLEQLRYYEQLRGTASDLPRPDDADPNSLRARMVGAVGYVAGKRGVTEYVRQRLERAGLPLRPTEYMSLHIVFVVVFGFVIQLLVGSLPISILVVIVATMLPMAYIGAKARSRTEAFEEQLPDVLNLIAGSLRAGWGMLQAIDVVVQEMLPPASVEFKRVQTEARLGLPIEDALHSMAERLGSEDFDWAVAAIAIQREVGGNLAEVLDIVASTIRERSALRRQVKALTAEGRISAYILIALPFLELIMLLIINPTYMSQLFESGLGLMLLAAGMGLLFIGSVWLMRVMKVEV